MVSTQVKLLKYVLANIIMILTVNDYSNPG